jgi:predicted lactoylglutathione lyase
MAVTANQIFVNLPVKDLTKTNDFFAKIGFEFNPQFSNDSSTCMVVSEHIFVMLLVEDQFKAFSKKEIPDASTREMILALSAETREQVDELADKALAAGAKPANDPQDHGFMYGRSFQDLDGHLWEVMWMDPSGFEQG